MISKELMSYFDFDESDLIQNQSGNLSSKQHARLIVKDRSSRKIFFTIGVVLALLTFLSLTILWLIDKLTSVGWYSLVWVIPCGFLAFLFIRAGRKLVTYTLRKTEGAMEVTKGGSYNDPTGIYYELQVGEKNFGISEGFANRMKKENGETYAVYYYWSSETKESDLMDSHILSIEKVTTK